ncbi:phosphotransferase [Bacillus cereus group sp. BfR-BA-01347]|uniref:phosphotransferase n=1 Tax=Bacillus cereus group sp. BfR-BA-01347 TaxID=2920310 RepID=UPI001F59BE5C|nr:phosphotransferase [Bacillus cereus group sp. BfR-BA-01347]
MNKQKVVEIARKYGLEVKEESIKFNESGLDFLVAYAKDDKGEEWVLRFPRRDDVMPRTIMEKKALDLLNQYVNFQVPIWSVYHFSQEDSFLKEREGSQPSE